MNKIKREDLQQTKNSTIEKEKNIKTIKQLQEEKNTMEKQMTDPKTLKLHLETNLHRKQNNETQQTAQREDRLGKRREKKLKNTGNERKK